ncbi:hypothetical protein HK105_201484 [Polyrhizophydium stewartii]|uniref:Uncharacterized protein n=1 Tax=Polyrhizophydium stewartii TaxID=2732419 RepID=A0ABR4N708_9FUNG
MLLRSLLLPLALLARAACAPAPALADSHRTDVQLVALDGAADAAHFAVAVQRTDVLTDAGAAVAERTARVLLRFDVSPTGEVALNDVPVPMGVSNLKVSAKTVVALTDKVDARAALDAFGAGIVSVEVAATGAEVRLPDGGVVRRITLLERVLEVDGRQVTQDERIQQVVEIMPDGAVVRGRPCAESHGSPASAAAALDRMADATPAGPHHGGRGRHHGGMRHALGAWVRRQPVWAKLLLCLAWSLAVAGAAFAAVHGVAMLVLRLRGRPAAAAAAADAEALLPKHQPAAGHADAKMLSIDVGKLAALGFVSEQHAAAAGSRTAIGPAAADESLPAYTRGGYAAVASQEPWTL